MSVQNQKKIIIERSSDNAKKDYLKVSNKSLRSAMYNLRSSAFLLWIYFVDNSHGYHLDLYPVDFCNMTGLSDSTYRRAFAELEQKGYMVSSAKQKNLYLFREVSPNAEEPDTVCSIDKKDFDKLKEEFFAD